MAEINGAVSIAYSLKKTLIFGTLCPIYSLAAQKQLLNTAQEKQVLYIFYIKKASDSSVFSVPIKSFQTRQKLDESGFFSVVCPAAAGLASKIAIGDRMSVSRRVVFLDDSVVESEIAYATIDLLMPTRSPEKTTLQIEGHQVYTNLSPKSVVISDITYMNYSSDASLTFDAKPNSFLQPGDYVIVDGSQYTAQQITLIVDESTSYMEVRCA